MNTDKDAVWPLIHKFYQDGLYIVMDVNSGIVHLTDQLTYDLLDIYDGTNRDDALVQMTGKYLAEEVRTAIEEVDDLMARQFLFAPMDDSFTVALEERPIIKALCLNIAHDCNLRCKYCFAARYLPVLCDDFGRFRC